MTTNLDDRRLAALDQVQKSERQAWYFGIAIFVWEMALIAIIFFFVDFSNTLHVLIFLSTGIVYGTIGIGLVSLGAFNRQNTLRVLAAIELMRPEAP